MLKFPRCPEVELIQEQNKNKSYHLRTCSALRSMNQILSTTSGSQSFSLEQVSTWLYPWHFTGLKKYSYFLASDDDYMVFRKFGMLNARVLLSFQDSISVDEAALQALDNSYSRNDVPMTNNGSFREDPHVERKELIASLQSKLHKYSETNIPLCGIE